MSISLSKLETMLAVKFLKKRSMLNYPMIIAKIFKGPFGLNNVNVESEMATRQDEARRGELDAKQVKSMPNSLRLVDLTPTSPCPVARLDI